MRPEFQQVTSDSILQESAPGSQQAIPGSILQQTSHNLKFDIFFLL